MTQSSTISIGILTLPDQMDSTVRVVDTLLAFKRPEDDVFVHQNGPGNEASLKRLYEAGVSVSASRENLGVAGGRNELTKQVGFIERDIAVFLDNDVVISHTLLDEFRLALNTDRSSAIGAVATPMYSWPRVRRRLPDIIRTVDGPLHSDAVTFDVNDLHRARAGSSPLRPTNGGSNPNPIVGYFSVLPYLARIAGSVDQRWARFHQAVGAYDAEPEPGSLLECGAVHGGCTGYRTAMIGVAPFSPLFNPYGSEDIDLAMRIRAAGYPNYVMLRSVALHGTDDRHQPRISPSQALAALINRGRTRAILAHRHLPTNERGPRSLAPVLGEALTAEHAPAVRRNLWAALVGRTIAERQIACSGPPDWIVDLPLDVRRLAPDRFGLPRSPPALTAFERAAEDRRTIAERFLRDPTALEVDMLDICQAVVDDSSTVQACLAHSVVNFNPQSSPEMRGVKRSEQQLDR